MYADPYHWQDYLDRWGGDFPKKVFEFPTNVETRMDKAIRRFLTAYRAVYSAVLSKGKRKAAREQEDPDGAPEHYLKLQKKRESDDNFIDDFVAMILAYEARGQAIEDGALVPETTQPFFMLRR
jgi:uncharacterized protein YktA (UPF0223 family)